VSVRPAKLHERSGTHVGAGLIVLALIDGRLTWYEALVAGVVLAGVMLVQQRKNPSGRP
jgi:hypothetical protein